MKKTRITGLIMAAAMILGTMTFAFADEGGGDIPDSLNENPDGDKVICPIEETEGQYISFTGEIEEVIDADGRIGLRVTHEEGQALILWINENTYLADMGRTENIKSFTEGMNITAYYHIQTPLAMSEPGQLTPYVVIINDENSVLSHKVDFFDGNGLSSDGGLVISLSEETQIVDFLGNPVDKVDAFNNALLIYYNVVATSYPGQTAPQYAVILKDRLDIAAEDIIMSLEDEHIIQKDNATYVAIRPVAEALGYVVDWDSDSSTAILKMEGANVTFTLTVGSNEYGFNKSIHRLQNSTIVYQGKTFVDGGFVRSLLGVK